MAEKRKLNEMELAVQESFRNVYDHIPGRRTPKPLIVAVIGLVGSGKSRVAQALASQLGAVVIENDAIRIELQRTHQSFDRAWSIAEKAALEIVQLNGNVILDSDFADAKKRASLRDRTRRAKVDLVFIRTHCDFGVMFERIRTNDPGQFFNLARSLSTAPDKGKDVKMVELTRRLPHHYRWIKKGGGRWILKKFPFAIALTIDTTDSDSWKQQVEIGAKHLISLAQ